jgi:23S rRNA (cytidine1920-2'-O)/16S rRNA (cytidine1409-2'-O)-methyltransferase
LSGRIRLDLAIEERGLAPSRARARDAVLRGTVRVNGIIASKPGQLVGPADLVTLADPAAGYVSRAALKLIAGLDAGGIEPAGKVCLDVGASTGGFTQVLLARGATKVYAVDVGRDQLHASLRGRPEVVVLEQTNARDLDSGLVPEPVDLIVSDVSFVSVTKVLAAPLALCRAHAEAVILVKPQFEVGRAFIGKGGIVTDRQAIARAEADVIAFMAAQGWQLRRALASPIAGGEGNRETLAIFFRAASASNSV